MRALGYDFSERRSGQHPRIFVGHGRERAWKSNLVCDGYAGYKALFAYLKDVMQRLTGWRFGRSSAQRSRSGLFAKAGLSRAA
jgi:hypothetical protein